MAIVKMLICAVLGAGVALLALVVYPGPLGMPWVGALVAIALIIVGSLLAVELARRWGTAFYSGVLFAVTLWFTVALPSNDMLNLPQRLGGSRLDAAWASLSLVCALVPALIATSVYQHKSVHHDTQELSSEATNVRLRPLSDISDSE